jgi:hypothetical protein
VAGDGGGGGLTLNPAAAAKLEEGDDLVALARGGVLEQGDAGGARC